MSKLYISVAVAVILAMTLVSGACSASKPTPTPAPTAPSTSAPVPSPTPAPALTAGQLAEQGKTVLATKGGCHGEGGQGLRAPAIIGSNAQLAKYNNAKQLLDYIKSTMPANAPGSLTQQEYLQVLCFMLLQNKFVTAETAIDPSQLERIALKN